MTISPLVKLAVITIAGLLVRLYRLGQQGLWFDEAYSVFIAKLPLDFSTEVLVSDSVHPPLYYLIQRIMLPLGEGEAAVRVPALLFGFLTIPFIYVMGKLWAGERTALIAAALAALSPFHIWYSQEARMYSALVMLSVLCMIAYSGLVRPERRRGTDLIFVLASAIAYFTHYFSLFLPLVQLAHLGINFKRLHRILSKWLLLQLIAAIPLLLWLLLIYRQPEVYAGIGWIEEPGFIDLWYTLTNFSIGFVEQANTLRWTGAILFGILAVLGARARWRLEMSASLAVLWALLPPLLTFLISLKRPIYVDRFLILSLPAIWLLVASGLNSLTKRAQIVVAAALLILLAYGIVTFTFGPTQLKEDWRAAAALLRDSREDEVLVVRTLQMVIPLAYYLPDEERIEVIEINRELTPISEHAAGQAGTWLLYWNPASDAHDVAATAALNLEGDSEAEIVDWMSGQGPEILERNDFPGLTVFHFDESGP